MSTPEEIVNHPEKMVAEKFTPYTGPINIAHDGEHLATVQGEFELLRFFRHRPFSLHHAVTYEGYSITDADGNPMEV